MKKLALALTSAGLLAGLTAAAVNITKRTDLTPDERLSLAQAGLKMSATENVYRQFATQANDAKTQLNLASTDYKAKLKAATEKHNAVGCELDFSQNWLCPQDKK